MISITLYEGRIKVDPMHSSPEKERSRVHRADYVRGKKQSVKMSNMLAKKNAISSLMYFSKLTEEKYADIIVKCQ